MINFLEAVEKSEISLIEAYVNAQNEMIRQTAVLHPTTEDFKNFELLQKQLKEISKAITDECIKRAGFRRNSKTLLWERHVVPS